MTYKNMEERIKQNSTVAKNGCWIWNLYKNHSGYGTMKVDKKMQLAHRISYATFIRAIPDSLCVLHRCDNPACVNPHHLWIGTNLDNVMDKVNKKRTGSKLNVEDVINIRASKKSTQELVKIYSVTESHINLIKQNKTWKHA